MSNANDGRSREELRQELAETLNALEYKLDVSARFSEWSEARKAQFLRAKDENPGRVYAIVGAVAAAAASIAAGLVMLAARKR